MNFTREVTLTSKSSDIGGNYTSQLANLIAMELASNAEFELISLADTKTASTTNNSAILTCLDDQVTIKIYSSSSTAIGLYVAYRNKPTTYLNSSSINYKDLGNGIYQMRLQYVNVKDGLLLKSFQYSAFGFGNTIVILNIVDLFTNQKMKGITTSIDNSGTKIFLSDGLENTVYSLYYGTNLRQSNGFKQILANSYIYIANTQDVAYVCKNLYSGYIMYSGFIEMDGKYYYSGGNHVVEVEEYV